jgi:hypothetical protein
MAPKKKVAQAATVEEREIPTPNGAEDRVETAARTLPRRRFFDDLPDKGLFAVFALIGFLAIIFLKTDTQIPSEVIAGVAVGAMVLYGLLAFRLPTVRIRPDRLGDNFYYLGFIFTLASLCAALLELRSAPRIEQLLGNFGIALVTTVVGVTGRVLFVQMRGELDDIDARVRRDLAAVSSDLRAQLSLVLREFETFHTGVLQAAAETMTKATQEAESSIREISAAGTERINGTLGEGHRQAELLSQMLMQITKAVSELPLMGKMELPSERLETQIASLASEIEALVHQLQSVTDTVSRRRDIRRRRWYWLYLR